METQQPGETGEAHGFCETFLFKQSLGGDLPRKPIQKVISIYSKYLIPHVVGHLVVVLQQVLV